MPGPRAVGPRGVRRWPSTDAEETVIPFRAAGCQPCASRHAHDPLALVSRLVSRWRTWGKPLHPRGVVLEGVLTRDGGRAAPSAWLSSRGADTVLVRLSRAAGLPPPLPDVHGLAVRVPVGDGHADLLLNSAGLGRLARFVPLPGRQVRSRPYSTLMPYRSPDGPVLLAAGYVGADRLALLWATPRSDWQVFGRLTLPAGAADRARDAEVSFDPCLFPVPGLEAYPLARRLREPAYRAAREQSGRSVTVGGRALVGMPTTRPPRPAAAPAAPAARTGRRGT